MERPSCQKPPMHSNTKLSQCFVKQGMTGLTQPTTATESNMRGSSLVSIRPLLSLETSSCKQSVVLSPSLAVLALPGLDNCLGDIEERGHFGRRHVAPAIRPPTVAKKPAHGLAFSA